MNETTTLRDLVNQAHDRGLSYRQMEEMVARAESRTPHPEGRQLNRTTANKIARGLMESARVDDATVRGIAVVAGVPEEAAFTAAGRRMNGPPFSSELPTGIDDLQPHERRVAIDFLRLLVSQRQELNRHADPSTATDPPAKAARASGTEDQKTERQLKVAARTRRPGIAPEDDGGAGIGEESQLDPNDDGGA